MTKAEREKAIDLLNNLRGMIEDNQGNDYDFALKKGAEALKHEQGSDEMTVEEYRHRMMQVFHNVNCDELIALCVLPTEKEFEHLEWFLKNHYKQKEPCEEWLMQNYYKQESSEDCISRANALRVAKNEYLRGWHNALCKALSEKYSIHCEEGNLAVIQEETITELGLSMDCAVGKDVENYMSTLPSVTPTTRWIPCSEKLPKDRENVLFSTKAGIVFEGKFFDDKTNFQWYEYCYKQFEPNNDVTAWTPLPKPYKAESGGK